MSCWLFKEEPDHYSFEHLQMDGVVEWEGVRNNLALKNLRCVKAGDEILYYHTGEQKSIVGLALCVEASVKNGSPSVRIRAVRRLKRPVALSTVKSSGLFNDSPLVRNPRLSVMPVDELLRDFVSRNELAFSRKAGKD